MKVLGAFVSPKGITIHSYNPLLVLKDVFHSSPSQILIWWYPLFKSFFEKYFAPLKQSIKGNQNIYLIVILLIALESMHICHPPSFFGLEYCRNNTWTQALLYQSFIQYLLHPPFYLFILLWNHPICCLTRKTSSWIKSIWCLILLIGRKAFEKSSTMISTNLSNKDLTSADKSSKFVLVNITLGLPIKQNVAAPSWLIATVLFHSSLT